MSAKTILVQMHHKALSFEQLRRKLVLVMQREFFDYISKEFQTGQLHQQNNQDSIHVHVYQVGMVGSELQISLRDSRSTDVRGVEQMLNLGRKPPLAEQEVIDRIRAKMPQARRLDLHS